MQGSIFAVVRIRGRAGIKKDISDTLKMLRLNSVNSCVLCEPNPSIMGMVKKVKDYVTSVSYTHLTLPTNREV